MDQKQLVFARLTYLYYMKYRKHNSPRLSVMYTLDYVNQVMDIKLDELAYFNYHTKYVDVLEMELIANYSYIKEAI